MKFSAVLDRNFTRHEVFGIMRILNGLSFLIYYLFVLAPNFETFFTSRGFIPQALDFFPGSWLNYFWAYDPLKFFLFVITVGLLVCYTIGYYARISQVILLPLILGFHNYNPLINHEPQQLNNLLLLVLCFAPIEKRYYIKRMYFCIKRITEKQEVLVLMLMQAYLGIFYFFAGAKKLPDPNWLNGTAVAKLSGWDLLGRGGFFSEICQYFIVSLVLSYLTLLFELSFFVLSWTKFRKYLLVFGLLFHLGISLTLDVGLFFWTMLMWYPLLLNREKSDVDLRKLF
jgi:hypothetical protein